MSRSARRSNDREYGTPWVLREFYGAPAWGILAVAFVAMGVGAFALLHH